MKRVLALLLALLMFVSMIPTNVFASSIVSKQYDIDNPDIPTEDDQIYIEEDLTLTEDMIVPEGSYVYIEDGVTVTVPAGIELNIQGFMGVWGNLIFEDGGILSVTGSLGIWMGKLDVTKADISGVLVGSVTISLDSSAEIKGIPDEMLCAATDVYSTEDVNAALTQASKYCFLTLQITDSTFTLTNSITIPDNAELYIWKEDKDADSMVIPSGVTLTNNGYFVLSSGRFVVETGGKFINNNYTFVDSDGSMLIYGELQQNGVFEGTYTQIEPQNLSKPVVKVSANTATGKNKLTWEAVPGADLYRVYRASSKNGSYSRIKSTSSTSYTDTTAKVGTNYYYKVLAVNSDTGKTSEYSAVVNRCCDLPMPKVKVSVDKSSGKPKVSWGKISGTAKFRVYRAEAEDGEYELIKTTTSTAYTDTTAKAGKTYYYKVRAIHSKSSANSAYSDVVNRVCDLAKPTVSIKLNSGDPKVTWKKVSGASKYRVYRATSKSGTYKLIKTTTKTGYTDTKAKAGKTYYYKVKAVHSNSAANSAYSSVKSIKAK